MKQNFFRNRVQYWRYISFLTAGINKLSDEELFAILFQLEIQRRLRLIRFLSWFKMDLTFAEVLANQVRNTHVRAYREIIEELTLQRKAEGY